MNLKSRFLLQSLLKSKDDVSPKKTKSKFSLRIINTLTTHISDEKISDIFLEQTPRRPDAQTPNEFSYTLEKVGLFSNNKLYLMHKLQQIIYRFIKRVHKVFI